MKQEVLVASSYCAKTPENNVLNRGARKPLCGVAECEQDLAGLALHRFLLELVGLVYHIELSELLSQTRGRKKTAFARQIAMYLAHTTGGLSLSSVGRLFRRDRTTVSHACALVEDARDELNFDRTLSHLESTISCQMQLFRLFSSKEASL